MTVERYGIIKNSERDNFYCFQNHIEVSETVRKIFTGEQFEIYANRLEGSGFYNSPDVIKSGVFIRIKQNDSQTKGFYRLFNAGMAILYDANSTYIFEPIELMDVPDKLLRSKLAEAHEFITGRRK